MASVASVEYEYGALGTYDRRVSGSEESQMWFRRGMVWCYAFHHEEAIYCFERALEWGACGMAEFGIAFAHGMDYNVNLANYYPAMCGSDGYPSMRAASEAARRALEAESSGVERALIEAVQRRVVWPLPTPVTREALQPSAVAFSEAMRSVFERFPAGWDPLPRAWVIPCCSPFSRGSPVISLESARGIHPQERGATRSIRVGQRAHL